MKHGTYVTYAAHGCRCEDCRKANRDYERARARRNLYGQSLFVPAEPVRQRVLSLKTRGMPENEIERAAHIDDKVIEALLRKHWRMPFDKSDPYQQRFARWCNHKAVFHSVEWCDYRWQYAGENARAGLSDKASGSRGRNEARGRVPERERG